MVYVMITLLSNPNEPEALEAYKTRAKQIRDEYGCQVHFRMNTKERVVGQFEEETVRILSFPSENHLKGWLEDPRYVEILPLRDKGYQKVTITLLEEPAS